MIWPLVNKLFMVLCLRSGLGKISAKTADHVRGGQGKRKEKFWEFQTEIFGSEV